MEKQFLYAQLDMEKLKEIQEKADEKISFIEEIFISIKHFIAKYLPEPLANLMIGGVGDLFVIILFLILLSIILKIFGVVFKIVWRVFLVLLLIGSLYVLYKSFFS